MALLMGLLLVGCQGRGYQERIYDEGVSLELAQWRKETIKELRYGLRFDIPEQRDEAIEAEACIRFVLERRQEVVLDFRERADLLHELRVNGEACDYAFVNEHIIIPKRATQKGENVVYCRMSRQHFCNQSTHNS